MAVEGEQAMEGEALGEAVSALLDPQGKAPELRRLRDFSDIWGVSCCQTCPFQKYALFDILAA